MASSSSPAAGELPCGDVAGESHCNDESSPYFVRVHRMQGVAGTCTQYTITVTAQGGAACDFTQSCQ